MTGPLYRLGGFTARRAPWVIIAWIVAALAIVLIANSTGRPTSDDTTIPGSDSTKSTDFLEKDLPKYANGSVPIVIESKSGDVDKGSNRTALQDTVDALKKDKYVTDVIDPLSEEGAGEISNNGKIASVSTFLSLSQDELDADEANQILDTAAAPGEKAGLEVSAGGYLGSEISTPSTQLSEIVGVVAAMIVLLIMFGTLPAMAMPLSTAIVGLLTGLGVIGILGTVIQVPTIASTLAIMLGLAVGIDYSLFILTRHIRQLHGGMEPHESVARAIATSGGAVVFAGGTVCLSLLCLYFGGVPVVRAIGYSAAIAVAVVIVAAMTLLPALLALIGDGILKLHIPFIKGQTREDPDRTSPSFSRRFGAFVGRHPIVLTILGLIVLAILALPALDLRLGAADNGQYPKDTTLRQAYDGQEDGFGVGSNGPLSVSVKVKPPAENDQKSLDDLQQQEQQTEEAVALGQEQPPSEKDQQEAQQQEEYLSSPASDPRLTKLRDDIQKTKDVKADSVSLPTLNDANTAAVFSAVPESSPTSERTEDLVNKLRDDVVPKAIRGTNLTVYVGGTTAANIDLATKLGDATPVVIVIIVALSFLLLTLAFRTIVVPALAAILNLFAVAASYGIITAVFEKGWGVELIGLEHSLPIVSYVPLMMFAILFGLSTDYTVFLLTRVSEEYALRDDHREAIVEGLGRAARVIVAAAAIMILVFGSFVINGDPTVKQFGLGFAVAVAIDVAVVCLVLPSVMLLCGRATWFLPKILDRTMPNLGIEGEEYFKERDAAKQA